MKTKRMISLLLAVLLTLSVAVTPAFAASAGDLLPAAESADVEESNDVVSIRLTTSGELAELRLCLRLLWLPAADSVRIDYHCPVLRMDDAGIRRLHVHLLPAGHQQPDILADGFRGLCVLGEIDNRIVLPPVGD